MRRKWRRWVLVPVLVAMPLVWLGFERLKGEWKLAGWIRSMAAQGEPLTIAEVARGLPAGSNVVIHTPDGWAALVSGIELPAADSGAQPPAARWIGTEQAMAVASLDSWVDDRVEKVWTWADFEEIAAPYREQLRVLGRDLTHRQHRVTLDYEAGADLLLPHLAGAKNMALALSAETVWALHRGELEAALDSLRAMTGLCRLLQADGLLISELVAVAVATIAQGALWEALQIGGWTDAQLELLQAEWEKLSFLPSMAAALSMERAVGLTYFPGGRNAGQLEVRELIAEPAGAGWLTGAEWPDFLEGWVETVGRALAPLRTWVRYAFWRAVRAPDDQLFHLAWCQTAIEATRAGAASGDLRSMQERLEGLEVRLEKEGRRRPLSRFLLPVISSSSMKAAQAGVTRDLALTAIALQRHRLRHRHWPETLEALVPEFLERLPLDAFAGQPFRYQPLEDGSYRLYSVGENGRDDGGNARAAYRPTGGWYSGPDLVWPRPATGTEVAAYQARQLEAFERRRRESNTGGEVYQQMLQRYGLLPPVREDPGDPADSAEVVEGGDQTDGPHGP